MRQEVMKVKMTMLKVPTRDGQVADCKGYKRGRRRAYGTEDGWMVTRYGV